jgi:hypothetical protein
MNNFFEENHELVYQEWISPEELKNAKVLDLGSQTAWLGEYCMMHGAAEYTGVDIDDYHNNHARLFYPNFTIVTMDLEDYVKDCVKEQRIFDIVVISRTIQGIQNQATLLQNISKITNNVVIESGVPINKPAYMLAGILRTFDLTEKQKSEIASILNYIEYEQPFVEYVIDDRWPQPVPSTGFFKEIFATLGFELSLDTYESVKQKYPDEYGYDVSPDSVQRIKRSILKFKKVSSTPKSLTWQEWLCLENI